jgi:arylsulfatase A
VSGCFGKWGQLPLQPSDFGFDEYMRFQNSGVYWKGPKNSSYVVNGKTHELAEGKYMPDLVHEYLLDFIKRHRDRPFFAYYSMSHIHGEIVRTPDSAPGSKDLFADNIAYMDKLVGNVIDELEKLKLRDRTLVIFVGDNGTGQQHAKRSTIGGKPLSGNKSQMLEGGALVPMIANWPSTTPAGKISTDLMDFSDYLPTLAELAGAPLPAGVVLDGRSFAAQLRGKEGKPRDWAFVELGAHWYVRDANWKLNEAGELFDMRAAPFEETLVPVGSENPEAKAERKKLQATLERLDPVGGKTHRGNPSGKHERKKAKKTP